MPRVLSISLDLIDEPRVPMRTEVYEDSLDELARSMRESGLIEPLVVRPNGDRYELVVGLRRLYAARRLGWSTIDCVVRDLPEEDALIVQAAENVQREDVNPYDRALYFRALLTQLGCSQRALANRLGLSDTLINRTLRLLDFDEEIQEAVRSGRLNLKAAHLLAKFPSRRDRLRYLRIAVENGASLRTIRGWLHDAAILEAVPGSSSMEVTSFPLSGTHPVATPHPGTSFPSSGGHGSPPVVPPASRPCELCGKETPAGECLVLAVCSGCYGAVRRALKQLEEGD